MPKQTTTNETASRSWRLAQAAEARAYAVEALGGDATQLRRLAVELGEAAIRAERG